MRGPGYLPVVMVAIVVMNMILVSSSLHSLPEDQSHYLSLLGASWQASMGLILLDCIYARRHWVSEYSIVFTNSPTSTGSPASDGTGPFSCEEYDTLLNKMQSISTSDVATLAYPSMSF